MHPDDPAVARDDFDYALVGGGLQSALLVLALRALRPKARIALVEREARLGGNHTWCFHAGDVSDRFREWLRPLVAAEWNGYEVCFEDGARVIDDPYAAILSDRLDPVLREALAGPRHALLTGVAATALGPDGVVLADGRRLRARLVVDARGPGDPGTADGAGFQKFLGHELRLARPHGLDRPVLMDATVPQVDGFRFFYLLPLDHDRVLVEDTCFSSDPRLHADRARAAVDRYVRERGWTVAALEREECGVLPMPWTGETAPCGPGVLEAGYRGGWFHPGTGYSLPVAARLAEAVARHSPEEIRGGALRGLRREHERQRSYCHLLNRLLFRWYPPAMRWNIFARFYRLPRPVIARFYALRMTGGDQARLLVGRPPRGLSLRYRLEAGATP